MPQQNTAAPTETTLPQRVQTEEINPGNQHLTARGQELNIKWMASPAVAPHKRYALNNLAPASETHATAG